jgi:hypothetical protein
MSTTAHYYTITIYTGPDPSSTATATTLPKIVEVPELPHNWVEPPPGIQVFGMTVPKGGIATIKEYK